MFRGYDFPQLFREDTIKRVDWICSELGKLQAKIEAQKSEETEDDSDGSKQS
jgi:hypothetical protein